MDNKEQNLNREKNKYEQYDKVKAFQELPDVVEEVPEVQTMKPTPQAKDIEEIEY